jgi:hypothetical protein
MTGHPARRTSISFGGVFAGREPAGVGTGLRSCVAAMEQARSRVNLPVVAAGKTIGPLAGAGAAECESRIKPQPGEATS